MKRLSNKGFTLVELLAVIVILGVIMLIAIPSVGTIIKNARFNSFVSSGKMYISTAQNYMATEMNVSPGTYYLSIYELNGNKLSKSPINSDSYINGYVKVKIDENGNPTYTAHICEISENHRTNYMAGCQYDKKHYYVDGLTVGDGREVVKTNPEWGDSQPTEPYLSYPHCQMWLTATKWDSCSSN